MQSALGGLRNQMEIEMTTGFQVFASYVSVISNSAIRFQLVEHLRGVAFKNLESGKIESGTYVEGANKFEALDSFRKIYCEMKPSFELL